MLIEKLKKLEKINWFKEIVNQQPPAEWLTEFDDVFNSKGEKVKFLPLSKINYLLDTLFEYHTFEVIETTVLPNMVEKVVRIHFLHPITKIMCKVDGSGGCGSTSGSCKIDIMIASPTAETRAKKNACKKLGALFGRDIGNEETQIKSAIIEPVEIDQISPFASIKRAIELSKTKENLQKVSQNIQTKYKEEQINETEFDQLLKILNTKIDERTN